MVEVDNLLEYWALEDQHTRDRYKEREIQRETDTKRDRYKERQIQRETDMKRVRASPE